ncbi:MAG: glycosyltransferase family 4 protein [Anaerolineae bacterium]|nr:glycosyltransferase family 4 protein [Anaerolineae bacterium]
MTKRVCIVSQRNYPGDARLSNQVLAFQNAGWEVEFVGTRPANKPAYSFEENVRCYRLPSLERMRASKIRYVFEYVSFLLPAMFFLIYLHLKRHYAVIFITNLPDPLVLAGLFPKLMGAKLLFDLREVTPEMLEDRFGYGPDHPLMKISVWLEQFAIRFVDQALSTNDQMRNAVLSRGADPNKVGIMLNLGWVPIWKSGPQLPDPNDKHEPFRLVMHGTILKRYGLEYLFEAMKLVVEKVPDVELEIIGKGEIVPTLQQQVKELGLEKTITFPGFMWYTELVPRLRRAHAGIIFLLNNVETRVSHTHKMYEYFSLGVPIIASRTEAVAAFVPENCIYFVESENVENVANAILDLYEHPEKCYNLAKTALDWYTDNCSSEVQQAAFMSNVDKALGLRPHAFNGAQGLSVARS